MRVQGTHLISFPGRDLSLLDYITIYRPYLMHTTLNMRSVDVEVKPGMAFLWPTSDYEHIHHQNEVDIDLYHNVITSANIPFCDVDGFKVPLSEQMIYTSFADESIEKNYRVCIFPSTKLSRSTWCQLISSLDDLDEAVIVDEYCYDPHCETYDIPATDMRGMDLTLTLDVIRQSEVVIGPPSGIVALAAYSNVPFITYGGIENNPWKDHDSYNPFETFGMSFRGVPSDTQLEEAMRFVFEVLDEEDNGSSDYKENPNEADLNDDEDYDEGLGHES